MRLFVLLCFLFALPAQAIVLTVTQAQLNAAVQPFFPLTKSYQGVTATFSNPNIELDALDDTIEVAVTVRAQRGDEYLIASGKLDGRLEYDQTDKVLHIEEPRLKDFKVRENNMQDADEVIRIVRQTIGRKLPVILLIDFNELNIEYLQLEPKDIDITSRGLVVMF